MKVKVKLKLELELELKLLYLMTGKHGRSANGEMKLRLKLTELTDMNRCC